MKLTEENIKFIETYLNNTPIDYIDVRIELTDHIAAAVEVKMQSENSSFYDAFKCYMVENKQDLLKSQEKLKKKNQLEGFAMVWKRFKKPWGIAFFLMICTLLLNFKNWFAIDFPYIAVMWSLLIIISFIYIVFSYPIRQNRFSGLEALGWVMFFVHYLIQVLFNFGQPKPLFYEKIPFIINLLVSVLVCFGIAWIVTFFEQRKLYRRKFRRT